MTASKTKFIILCGAALVLALGLGVVATWQFLRYHQTAPEIQGLWEGALEVQTVKLRLMLKVDKSPEGAYTATIDSIDQGARDIPVDKISLQNRQLNVQLPTIMASYEGRVNGSATEISGKWQQAGTSHPLKFRRTTNAPPAMVALPATAYAQRADSPLQGYWKGTIHTDQGDLRLLFKIAEVSPGNYQATLDSLDQGAKNLPVTSMQFTAPNAQMTLASIGGHFEGTIDDPGSTIDGNWTQGGRNFQLILTRTKPEDEVPLSESDYAFINDTELQGLWKGTLQIKATKLRLVLKIAKAADGTYRGLLDSVDQGAKEIPASSVTFQNGEAQMEWKALRASYQGRLEDGELIGTWQQSTVEFPLNFQRSK